MELLGKTKIDPCKVSTSYEALWTWMEFMVEHRNEFARIDECLDRDEAEGGGCNNPEPDSRVLCEHKEDERDEATLQVVNTPIRDVAEKMVKEGAIGQTAGPNALAHVEKLKGLNGGLITSA